MRISFLFAALSAVLFAAPASSQSADGVGAMYRCPGNDYNNTITAAEATKSRIDWTKPVNESIVVIGDKYQLYRPKLGQAIRGTTSQAKNSGSAGGALAFVSMSKAQLQANYNVQYIGQEGVSDGTQTWHILMTPKVPTNYKSAELWVDANGMPRQAMIKEQNDDTTTVLLTNIEKNADVKASVFAMDLPAGTKIVKG